MTVPPSGPHVSGRWSLPDKVLAVHGVLHEVPHAFGGALALAYYAEPRATHDIDINLFVGEQRSPLVTETLSAIGVTTTPAKLAMLRRDGQGRLDLDGTPLDLFFAYDPFHEAARRSVRTVPFADGEIPVLSATHLAVCKVVFDRPKDWVDIDSMLAHNAPIDAAEVLRWVGRIAGDTDPRYDRIARVLSR